MIKKLSENEVYHILLEANKIIQKLVNPNNLTLAILNGLYENGELQKVYNNCTKILKKMEESVVKYTPAQLRAFEWLPSDGSFRHCDMIDDREIYDALYTLYELLWIKSEITHTGVSCCLTFSGMIEKARLFHETDKSAT